MTTPILHLMKWNDEFIKYLNTFPEEIEDAANCKDLETGRPAVKVKYRGSEYFIYYLLYYCDCCKQQIACMKGFDGRRKKRCEPCRKKAAIVANRKSSRTYRKKHASKTRLEIPCKQCNQLFNPFRSTRLYCSNKCRQRSYRAK